MRALFLGFVFVMGVAANASENPPMRDLLQQSEAAIDYNGFTLLTKEVQDYRQSRLVSKQSFLEMAEDPDTIILDTRSKDAFENGHIKGAVHLNFSDFTEEKLAKAIGSKDRRILIYCNNNFTDNVRPFPLKRLELALNIPTFINLYGYGYENIYELKDSVSMFDPQMQIVSIPRD